MRSRDSLLVALVAAVVGMTAGYLLASLMQGERPVEASGPVALSPASPKPRAAAKPSPAAAEELRGVERTTAAASAPAAAPEVRLPQAELERTLDAIEAPTVAEELGDGEITGLVSDELGQPLQGVVVVARRSDATRANDPGEVGDGPPPEPSLEDHLRQSAKSWARSRSRTRRATSGVDGRFVLDGLDVGASYSLSAYLEGHVLEAEGSAYRVSAGQRIDFRAEAVHQIPVQLVFEGGGQPTDGVVGVSRGDREQLYTWSSEAPLLRLTPGRVGLRGYSGEVRGQGGREEVDSAYASDELSLEVVDQAGAPVQLTLKPRTGIRGRVVDEFGVSNGRLMVRLLAMGSEGVPDLAALSESDRYARLSGDRFHLLDLAPGAYAIGLSDWSQALLAHQVVQVGDGVAEVDLVVPEPDPDQHLIVRAFGPTGRALRDVEFRWRARTGRGSRSGGIQGRRAADGAYWLRPKQEYFEPWGAETSYTLTVEHSELGSREVLLEEGQREVDVTYAEPVTLVVVVAGYASSGYAGRLEVSVSSAEDPQAVGSLRYRSRRMRTGSGGDFSPDGVARIEGLAPGTWKVDLSVKTGEWQTRRVQSVEVVATSGEQTVAMDMPALYDLVVAAPGLSEGSRVFVNPVAGDDAAAGGYFGDSKEIDRDGRAVFRGLAAGDYTVRANGVPEPVQVTVPCGEVFLDAKEPDCLRVSIGDMEGAMYKAGLRAGDLVLAVDGVQVSSNGRVFEALMGEGEVELTVLRDGQTSVVPLKRIASGSDWFATLGGMLSPASRP